MKTHLFKEENKKDVIKREMINLKKRQDEHKTAWTVAKKRYNQEQEKMECEMEQYINHLKKIEEKEQEENQKLIQEIEGEGWFYSGETSSQMKKIVPELRHHEIIKQGGFSKWKIEKTSMLEKLNILTTVDVDWKNEEKKQKDEMLGIIKSHLSLKRKSSAANVGTSKKACLTSLSKRSRTPYTPPNVTQEDVTKNTPRVMTNL